MYVLAILWMTVKRIVSNWRLEAALLFGLVLAVAIVSSIPIYTSAGLQESLVTQWLRQSGSRPPLGLMMTHSNTDYRHRVTRDQLIQLTEYLERELPRQVGIQPINYSRAAELGINYFGREDGGRSRATSPYVNLKMIDRLQELSVIVDGRWFEPRADGVIEVVTDENTLEELQLLVGDRYIYEYAPRDEDKRLIPFEIVGVFRPRSETLSTENWVYPPPFSRSLFVHPDVFDQVFLQEMGLRPSAYDWYFVFDYRIVRVHRLEEFIRDLTAIESRAGQIVPDTRFWLSPLSLFRWFHQRSVTIASFLSALSVPIVGMVLYYVVLIAGLTVERRRNEIAVLHSRGAGRVQIAVSFFLEWALLGVLALLIGPYLGLWIARIMGASAGFLTFVGRKALPVAMTDDAYRYGLYAVLLAIGAAMIPAIQSSRHSIVSFKQELARGATAPVWYRYFFDFLLLGIAAYGYRALSLQSLTAPEGLAGLVDPLLFFVPVVFLLGAGLLFLRLYPIAMQVLMWISARLPGIVWNLTLRQLTRNSGQYMPLLLLLILTVSLGIYTASTARTLDRNFVDQIYHSIGADLSLAERWTVPGGSSAMTALAGAPGEAFASEERVYEPPFYIHTELPGVESAARVLSVSASARAGGRFLGEVDLMAIIPYEFGLTAWWRDDLSPHHFYDHLNLLTRHREGAIVSRRLLENTGLTVGDVVTLTFKNQPIEVYIAGVVDYWPTLGYQNRPFFIANLDYVQEMIALEPYNVWLSLEGPGYLARIVEELRNQGIYVISLKDANSQIVQGRNEPHRMGFYGILSIGFVVSSLVTVLGFILYTFLSMRSRLLQFGVLRAVGLSLGQLIALLGLEQVLSLGLGLGAGLALGLIATQIFLPFLRESGDAGVIPFAIVTDPADVARIFTVLGAMLVVAIAGLSMILVRMKLNQAIKLGEEA